MRHHLPASTLCLSLLLVYLVEGQAPEPVLETRTALDGRLSLLVPKEFTLMSEEMILKKYPRANRPSLVFTNTQTTINIALDHTAFKVGIEELPKAKQAIRGGLETSFPSAQWFRDELKAINGRQFFVLEMRTPAADTDIRNLMIGTSLEGRLFVITFNVTKALEGTWMPIGNRVVESVQIR
jgi:hypothetical protein